MSFICLKCLFSGYKLSGDGKCKLIDHCIISNGIDSCAICEEGYILDEIGRC